MINSFYAHPLGCYIYVETEEGKIKKVGFGKSQKGEEKNSNVVGDLKEYLSGRKIDFSRYKVDLSSLTTFERSVLLRARRIPFGKAVSYRELASRAGTKAVRAAGNALARNPAPIIIPCHRVLRKNRELGGYSAGVGIKKKLLEIEGIKFNIRCDYRKGEDSKKR